MNTENKMYAVITFLIFMLVVGTIIYHNVEKWSYFDSLYFSTTTLATVGFGDLHPTTYVGKFFTIFYVIFGVSSALYAFTLIAEHYFEHRAEKLGERLVKRKENFKNFRDRIKTRKEDLIK